MNAIGAFGEVLRRHRLKRQWAHAALAERAGLSERAVSDLELGLKAPQRATLRQLIHALDLEPEAAAFTFKARTLRPATDSTGRHSLPT